MDRFTPQQAAADSLIKQLRQRLLDLTNGNKLLNFRHTPNSRTHIRIIDELPDYLYAALVEGKRLHFQSLPEPPDEPTDERSDGFRMALEQARATDPAYIDALRQLETEGEGADTDRAERLERELKDRVRERLGLPPWRHPNSTSLADYAKSLGWSPDYELPEPDSSGAATAEHTDNQIRVLHLAAPMERKLSGLHSYATTALKETGVNTLYVAFGFLEWRARPPGPSGSMLAPLLLLPVQVDRKLDKGVYRYGISGTGDDPEINLTLAERLVRDFGLRLPELDEDDTPEQYFAKVGEKIATQPNWRVRRFVTIGHFAFARLVMYKDLDEERWGGEGGLARRGLLARLLGGAAPGDTVFAPEHDVDDPRIAADIPALVTDADSSQFSAVVDVMRGQDLALKGPPGTGKSQTITNIIAAALAGGKRVLFVAEKMAALEVVKKRLDDAGLGAFCLELHSTKARKRDVLDSLQARIAITGTLRAPSTFDATLRDVDALKRRLTGYARLINQPFGQLGKTIQELLWSEQRTRARAGALPGGLDDLFMVDAEAVTPSAMDRAHSLLDIAEALDRRLRERYGSVEAHPWYGVRSGELTVFEQREAIQAVGRWRDAALTLSAATEALAKRLGPDTVQTVEAIASLALTLDGLPAPDERLDGPLIGRLLAREPREKVGEFLALINHHDDAVAVLGCKLHDVEAALGWTEELATLAERARGLECAEISAAGLTGRIGGRASEAHALRCSAALGDRLLRLFGLSGAPTVRVTERLAQAAAFAAETPQSVVQRRRPALTHPDAREAVRMYKEKASALKEQRWRLDAELTVPADATPEALREHRDTVAAAGVFAFLRGSYRAARRAQRVLRPGSRAKPHEMAADFERVAGHLEDARDFEADADLRAMCGPRFAGIGTDFDSLLEVVGFADGVRRRFAGRDEASRAAREVLLDGDPGLFAELAAIDSLDGFEAVRATLDALCASPDADLHAEAQTASAEAAELRQLVSTAAELGLTEHTALGEGAVLADWLRLVQAVRERIGGDRLARKILGDAFKGTATDVAVVRRHLEIAEALSGERLPAAVAGFLRHPDFPARLARLRDLIGRLNEASADLERVAAEAERAASLDIEGFLGATLREVPLGSLLSRLDRSLEASEELVAWVDYRRAMIEVEAAGLDDIVAIYLKARRPLGNLRLAYDRVLYRSLARLALERHPELKSFSGLNQEQARRRFQELDRRIIKLNQERLAARLCRVPVPRGNGQGAKSTWTDLALIQYEASRQRPRTTIRDLLARAGDAAAALKPCFMMSPLSVAQFLTPGTTEFDLVVIDEASQMRPEDAIGAAARGRQIVVVGDPMQLPPTSFFDRVDDGIDDDDGDGVAEESILDMALATFRPARELRWHYRSRHESLIAFSNKQFYNDRLIVFPSPVPEHPDLGVRSVKVDGLYRGRMNVPEAQAVAEAAVRFMHEHPRRSLGVVTLNQPQRDLLLEEIERMVARDPEAAAYVERWSDGLEPFFVKNLENVQGDERDVIMISTTYGPDESGQVMQRFGPINSDVGHRRLNVLFTRAKEEVKVFTSLAANDIKVAAASKLGVAVFRDYLEYAVTGRIETGKATGGATESPFEDYVKEALERRGFEVVPQVSVAGYRIDLGVRHPAYPSGFLLGIECDGATYHSSRSVRDRDRLRQEVLERLGWRLYRIWSTDWFNNPRGELARLEAHIGGLLGNVTPIAATRRA